MVMRDQAVRREGELAQSTWTGVPEGAVVLVPVGSTEQHGPHLPLHTDTVVAEAVARLAARRLAGGEPDPGPAVLIAPALAFGASGEHAGFPGTVSIGHQALSAVLVELVRSLALWAGRTVFVNGHGGNAPTLAAAVRRLRGEGHSVDWAGCELPGADAHAGRTETSLMLHLAPELVRLDAAEPGDTRPIAELLPELRAGGLRAVTANGVLGDPAGASAAEGSAILEAMADRVAARVGPVGASAAGPRSGPGPGGAG
jgi:creatinine amidohydrolase